MSFKESILSVFENYFVWQGRASRSEFWWFYLFYIAGYFLTAVIDSTYGVPVLNTIFLLAVFIPFLSVFVRRLHDTGHSGWWYWIILMPVVIYTYEGRSHKLLLPIFGFMYSLKLLFTLSEEGENQYGSSPMV